MLARVSVFALAPVLFTVNCSEIPPPLNVSACPDKSRVVVVPVRTNVSIPEPTATRTVLVSPVRVAVEFPSCDEDTLILPPAVPPALNVTPKPLKSRLMFSMFTRVGADVPGLAALITAVNVSLSVVEESVMISALPNVPIAPVIVSLPRANAFTSVPVVSVLIFY